MWLLLTNATTSRSRVLSTACDQVVAHDQLEVVAQLQHPLFLTPFDEPALALGQGVAQDDGHQVLVDRGLGLGRPAAGVLGQQLHRGVGEDGLGPSGAWWVIAWTASSSFL